MCSLLDPSMKNMCMVVLIAAVAITRITPNVAAIKIRHLPNMQSITIIVTRLNANA
jgi:hypothetical protein